MENNSSQKINKVVEIMQRAELKPRYEEHLRVFLFSIKDEPRFQKIVDIMHEKPDVFDLFSKCFDLKARFLEKQGSQEDWDYLLQKEKELLTLLAHNGK